MAVPKSASITFRIFTSTFFTMHVLYIIYIIRMKVKVIRIFKLSIYFFYLFKAKRVEEKPPHKFGESTFETMPKDASREIEKTPKYFIK